jgi:hypothetical protein
LRRSFDHRRLCAVAAATVAGAIPLATAATAQAQVSVYNPTPRSACSSGILLGVRFVASTGGSPGVTITVVTTSGHTVKTIRATATNRWRWWHVKGTCGTKYFVHYRTTNGLYNFYTTLR